MIEIYIIIKNYRIDSVMKFKVLRSTKHPNSNYRKKSGKIIYLAALISSELNPKSLPQPQHHLLWHA